jgi:L-lactate dehydrogenase complex protein LldF
MLCGSCTDVCPVKIDLHLQLYTWRNKLAVKRLIPASKRWGMAVASKVLGSPKLFNFAGRMARFWLPKLPRFLVYNRFNTWGKQRELPEAPNKSFREMYAERRAKR